jgi:hypothetical protein
VSPEPLIIEVHGIHTSTRYVSTRPYRQRIVPAAHRWDTTQARQRREVRRSAPCSLPASGPDYRGAPEQEGSPIAPRFSLNSSHPHVARCWPAPSVASAPGRHLPSAMRPGQRLSPAIPSGIGLTNYAAGTRTTLRPGPAACVPVKLLGTGPALKGDATDGRGVVGTAGKGGIGVCRDRPTRRRGDIGLQPGHRRCKGHQRRRRCARGGLPKEARRSMRAPPCSAGMRHASPAASSSAAT